jgi:RNA polymerase sigma-70 factor (ECF subfamily)
LSRVRHDARSDGVPSWEEVAHRHGDFVYTVAYRLTGNHHDAQDLVQEVLLRVQRGLSSYRPGSMEAWLGRITTNAFLDDVRRRRRRPAVAVPDLPESIQAGAPGADDALDHEVLPAHVSAALRHLPDDYRAAVVLCDVVGLSYEEISHELGVPVGTVRSRIHRGRERLRRTLG